MFDGPAPTELNSKTERVKTESGIAVIRQTVREVREDNSTEIWQFEYADTFPFTKCLNYRRTVFSPEGKEVRSEFAVFDDPFLGFPSNIIHVLSIPFVLSGMEMKKGAHADANLWNLDGRPTLLLANVVGQDNVKVIAGKFRAWKVKLSVDKSVLEPWGALGSIIAKFIPEFFFWYDVKPPNHLVKVKVVFGPAIPGSPAFYLELAEIRK